MKRIVFITISLLVFHNYILAQKLPQRPQSLTFVNDFANLLDKQTIDLLNQKLSKYHDSTSTQIIFVSVESLEGADLKAYSLSLAKSWGIGQAVKNNGILILIPKKERKIRLELGLGISRYISDARAKAILDENITPYLKEANFAKGLNEGIDKIIQLLKGKFRWEN